MSLEIFWKNCHNESLPIQQNIRMNASDPFTSDKLNSQDGNYPRQPRVLVVDDQPLHIQLLHRALPSTFQVFMATNGEQALRVALDRQPDLILLDVEMPDMDGFEVLRKLRHQPGTENTPVIFITGHAEGNLEARGLEAGAVDFITKPIHAKVVRARVHTHLQLKFQSDFLRQWVYIDGLTGAYNRRYFDEHLSSEWARAARQQQPLSLMMLDVDHFKAYNDRYGHVLGDEVLRKLVSVLKPGLLRPGDLLCRYGGEEFVCLLPNTGVLDALHVADRLRQSVEACGIEHIDNLPYGVLTICAGVAERSAAQNPEHLLALADEQLYKAKHSGKNRTAG